MYDGYAGGRLRPDRSYPALWLPGRKRQSVNRHDRGSRDPENAHEAAVPVELWGHADLLEKPGCIVQLEIQMAGMGRTAKYSNLSIYHSYCHSPGRLFYGCRTINRQCVQNSRLLSCIYAGGLSSGRAGFQL